jgi:hypothetical protein
VLRYEATLQPGTEATAWALIARPARWHEWAPHLRGAWGLDDPATGEVQPGRRGAVKLLGAVPIPVAIVAKEPGTAWTWRVGGVVDMDHRVERGRAVIEVRAPQPLEAVLGATYGPLIALLLRRLSRTGAARRPPTRTGSPAG